MGVFVEFQKLSSDGFLIRGSDQGNYLPEKIDIPERISKNIGNKSENCTLMLSELRGEQVRCGNMNLGPRFQRILRRKYSFNDWFGFTGSNIFQLSAGNEKTCHGNGQVGMDIWSGWPHANNFFGHWFFTSLVPELFLEYLLRPMALNLWKCGCFFSRIF